MKRFPFKPFLANAIRADLKTETRRLIPGSRLAEYAALTPDGKSVLLFAPDGKEPFATARPGAFAGDTVGIVEAWRVSDAYDHLSGGDLVRLGHHRETVIYEADFTEPEDHVLGGRRRLPRFLPDAFVRTKIEIQSVHVERLQAITDEQAKAEGIEWLENGDMPGWKDYRSGYTGVWKPEFPCDSFRTLWDSIHGETDPWTANPWVLRYVFKRVIE